MKAHIFLNFIFLVIREKDELYLSLESVTSIKKTYKPAKGSLSSSQLFVTSLHTYFTPNRWHFWASVELWNFKSIAQNYRIYQKQPSKFFPVSIVNVIIRRFIIATYLLKLLLTTYIRNQIFSYRKRIKIWKANFDKIIMHYYLGVKTTVISNVVLNWGIDED